jgi:hypothetical protein
MKAKRRHCLGEAHSCSAEASALVLAAVSPCSNTIRRNLSRSHPWNALCMQAVALSDAAFSFVFFVGRAVAAHARRLNRSTDGCCDRFGAATSRFNNLPVMPSFRITRHWARLPSSPSAQSRAHPQRTWPFTSASRTASCARTVSAMLSVCRLIRLLQTQLGFRKSRIWRGVPADPLLVWV